MLAGGGAMATPVERLESRTLLTTFAPTDDAFVRDGSHAATNYGADVVLQSKNDAAGYARQSYLRFDASSFSGAVGSATLRLFGGPAHTNAVVVDLYGVASTTWTEAALTWNNKPALNATALASATVQGTADGWTEWDVTGYVQQQKAAGNHVIGFGLKNPNVSVPFVRFNSEVD